MHPMQFSSLATYIGNQPSLLVAVRQPKTSTGHTLRQKPQALHISSPMSTSHRPAGPLGAFFSALNSAIPCLLLQNLQHDLLGVRDMCTGQPLGLGLFVRGDGVEDGAMLTQRVLQPVRRP